MLHALLRKIEPAGWEVGGARTWKSIRKLRVGAHHNDTNNVIALAIDAREAECDVLVFSRDRDGEVERDEAVEEGIRRAQSKDLVVAGSVAIPKLEAWILALLSHSRTEAMSGTKADATLTGAGIAGRDAMVAVVDAADLAKLPEDAASLRRWIARALAAVAQKT
ncbi:MAG TPA: hypothetical protein VGH87_04430 [Polyangiaceae bacterium]